MRLLIVASQATCNSWILRIRRRENYYHLISPITVSGSRLKYFLTRYRYVPDKSPECGLRMHSWTYFYRVSTHPAFWIRRLRFSYEEHENPVRCNKHADRNKYWQFRFSFDTIDAEKTVLSDPWKSTKMRAIKMKRIIFKNYKLFGQVNFSRSILVEIDTSFRKVTVILFIKLMTNSNYRRMQ